MAPRDPIRTFMVLKLLNNINKNVMIKLIKKAEKVKTLINVGDVIEYVNHVHDGRSYEDIVYRGSVVKVHKVNLDFVAENGNTYRVSKDKVTKLN